MKKKGSESKQLALAQFKRLHTRARLQHMHEIRQKAETIKVKPPAFYLPKTSYLRSLLILNNDITMASFSRNSPVNCDAEFDTKNVENKTAVVTGGKCSSKAPGCTSKTSFGLLK